MLTVLGRGNWQDLTLSPLSPLTPTREDHQVGLNHMEIAIHTIVLAASVALAGALVNCEATAADAGRWQELFGTVEYDIETFTYEKAFFGDTTVTAWIRFGRASAEDPYVRHLAQMTGRCKARVLVQLAWIGVLPDGRDVSTGYKDLQIRPGDGYESTLRALCALAK